MKKKNEKNESSAVFPEFPEFSEKVAFFTHPQGERLNSIFPMMNKAPGTLKAVNG
ncbi:hypothetical protein [Candidatus Sororendozoicomonas aggregata]|uniref:hypothetical protein n=1 Tax=Candidatus Sororendozoicomonas aggregata TaxID=3073239 RepID=UPI002ED4F1E6